MTNVELYKALHKFQGAVRGVKRDAKNPHFKNSYATLEQVEDTIRPHMQECGLIWYQFPGRVTEGGIEVSTTIAHVESGEAITGTMEVPLGKRDPQGAGSAVTYGLRYSLMAVLGLPPTDDDAETAIDRNDTRPAPDAAPVRSSASLKRDGAWESIVKALEADFIDCKSVPALQKLWGDYKQTMAASGWPKAWREALAEKFEQKESELVSADEPENILMAGG